MANKSSLSLSGINYVDIEKMIFCTWPPKNMASVGVLWSTETSELLWKKLQHNLNCRQNWANWLEKMCAETIRLLKPSALTNNSGYFWVPAKLNWNKSKETLVTLISWNSFFHGCASRLCAYAAMAVHAAVARKGLKSSLLCTLRCKTSLVSRKKNFWSCWATNRNSLM